MSSLATPCSATARTAPSRMRSRVSVTSGTPPSWPNETNFVNLSHRIGPWSVPGAQVRRQLVEGLAPAPLAIFGRVTGGEHHELIGDDQLGAPTPCEELDGDHRRGDANVAARDRHHVAEPHVADDVLVAAVLEEVLPRRAELQALDPADAEVVLEHLARPAVVARHVPHLQRGGVLPGVEDPIDRDVVRPADHDGVM